MIDKKHCKGCVDDYYNGNNDKGIEECWLLPTATFVCRVRVPRWQRPPYDKKVEVVPQCYRSKEYVLVKEENLTPAGYWW